MIVKRENTAIVVSVGPLIDDTDFKSPETAIAHNAAGMGVTLFQEAEAGVTATAITPTTGGANDWTHKGRGIYELEITAAQNNAQGTLWVEGIADGVLPFGSARYAIVAAKAFTDWWSGVQATIVTGVVTGTNLAGNRVASPIKLEAFQSEAKAFVVTVTAGGDPVDLSAAVLRFIAQNEQQTTVFAIEAGSITVSGANNNVATIAASAVNLAAAARHLSWYLRDTAADDQVLAWGRLEIIPANTS